MYYRMNNIEVMRWSCQYAIVEHEHHYPIGYFGLWQSELYFVFFANIVIVIITNIMNITPDNKHYHVKKKFIITEPQVWLYMQDLLLEC